MELHVEVRELVRAHGPEIVQHPGAFRAALEDVLGDDRSLPPGAFNLLVDAVRNRAVEPLVRIIDNGGDPAAAVVDVGRWLAQNRGGGDPAMCSWACAALGYGVGRVDDAVMARFSPTRKPPPPPPRLPPDHRHSRDTVVAPPPPPPPPLPPLPPPSRRRRWPLVVAVVLVLLLAAGGAVAWWQLGSDDDDVPTAGTSEPGGGGGDAGDTETIDLEEVNLRYSDLAENITARVSSCAEATPPAGAEEMLECTVPVGTLRLTTYASPEDLEAGRVRVIDVTRPYTLSGQGRGHAFYAFDPERSTPREPGTAELYWDSKFSRVAAHLTASSASDYTDVETEFGLTFPTVEVPSEPATPRLVAFIDSFPDVESCERTFTYDEGELEADWCTYLHRRWGELSIYVSTFRTRRDFLAYRSLAAGWEDEDDVFEGSSWSFTATPDAEEGWYHGYVADDGTPEESARFYIDDEECRCYLEAFGPDGEPAATPRALADVFLQ